MGAPYYIDLPAAKVPANAMLDFSGLNSGFDTIREQNNQNAMRTYQQGRDKVTDQRANAQLGMEQQRLDLAKQQANDTRQQQLIEHVGGIAQMIDQDQDPASRQAKWGQFVASSPLISDNLKKYGIDPADHVNGPKFIIGEARGYVDPLKTQQAQAELDKTKAEAESATQSNAFLAPLLKPQAPPAAQPQTPQAIPQSFTPDPGNPLPVQKIGFNAMADAAPPQSNAMVQPVADTQSTADENAADNSAGPANPGAVYGMPGDATVNTPMGQMTRDKARQLGLGLALTKRGDAGKMFMDAASGSDRLSKGAQTANDKDEIASTNQLGVLDRIKKDFNGKYLTYGNQFQNWTSNTMEKLGGTLNPQDKAELEGYSRFRQSSWRNLNRVLKDLSGTAVTENEMKRQLNDMPDPGINMFEGDGPTKFATKMKGAIEFATSAIARSRYLRNNGFTGKPWDSKLKVEDMPDIINQRGAEIEQQLKQQNPKADPGVINRAIDQKLKQEFGI